jgi:hypothetical protein
VVGEWQCDLSVTTFSSDGQVFQVDFDSTGVDCSGYDLLYDPLTTTSYFLSSLMFVVITVRLISWKLEF